MILRDIHIHTTLPYLDKDRKHGSGKMTTTHKNVRGLTARNENVDITELVLLSIALYIH